MKKLLLVGLLLLANVVKADHYTPMTFEDASKLQQDKVLVLITEISNCPFCAKIKELFLGPLSLAPEFGPYISIASINLESSEKLVGFDGKVVTQDKWAQQMGVDFSPTVLVLNPKTGKRLADDLVGLATPDFYGFYLEQNINKGKQSLGIDWTQFFTDIN